MGHGLVHSMLSANVQINKWRKTNAQKMDKLILKN